MKNISLFLCTLIIGIVTSIFYFKNTSRPITPSQNSTKTETADFSLDSAPKDSIKGLIISMSGEVNWQSRIATESAKLEEPRQIQQGEKIATDVSARAEVNFADFANIKISPKSEVDFIQTLPTNFVFAQSKGTTTYTNSSSNHLSVRWMHLLTDIGNGQITITINENRPIASVVVVKGQLTVAYNDLDNISQKKTFKDGEEFTFNDDLRRLTF